MKYPPAIVIWVDISTKRGWIDQDELDEFIMDDVENKVYQVGFIYEEDDNQICLLNSYFKNCELMGDITKIPKGAVLEIKRL